jgi:hypothetical protein
MNPGNWMKQARKKKETTGMESKIDSATVLTKVLQYSCNVGFDKFKADFAKAIDGYVSEEYADEKMTEMRSDFARFFCNLDDETKRRFTRQALLHYGIDGQ